MKTIEVSVNYVDRDSDPVMSTTVGIIVFNQEAPAEPPQVLNPFDFKTIALLKRYIDGVWAEQQALVASVEG